MSRTLNYREYNKHFSFVYNFLTLQRFFYQLLVLVIVKCEYISHSHYIAKRTKVLAVYNKT